MERMAAMIGFFDPRKLCSAGLSSADRPLRATLLKTWALDRSCTTARHKD
jgi:hypothetical protein